VATTVVLSKVRSSGIVVYCRISGPMTGRCTPPNSIDSEHKIDAQIVARTPFSLVSVVDIEVTCRPSHQPTLRLRIEDKSKNDFSSRISYRRSK
jgi:hypothetical protein